MNGILVGKTVVERLDDQCYPEKNTVCSFANFIHKRLFILVAYDTVADPVAVSGESAVDVLLYIGASELVDGYDPRWITTEFVYENIPRSARQVYLDVTRASQGD